MSPNNRKECVAAGDARCAVAKSHSFEDRPGRSGGDVSHSKSHTLLRAVPEKKPSVSSLVDELLYDIYGKGGEGKRKYSSVTNGDWSWHDSDNARPRPSCGFRSNLKQIEVKCRSKEASMIREEIAALENLIAEESNNLVKYLKRKDYLLMRREAHYDVITAVIQAISSKTREDMKMKFSLSPGTETGFSQWLDAMKMVAQLPGGVPAEFRMKLWLQLSERHLNEKNIDWERAEAVIFNEWTNPDDEELGVQIVKDLHRTGCSLFCGAQEQNQALLKRVLLAYARWNKNVGYCQGFNMLAALILQVMDRDEKNAVKVMIYLIEGVLPESYFANNLRGLSVDMAVFRDLLRLRLPKLSKHLEALQNDTNTGTSYEPPLTNVFTMQWFLTLFSNCLPQQTVLRVWDLVFLHGNEVLLRTALAIWGILQDRIISVESADEFYSIMGVVTREMLEFGLMDANNLVKMIVMVDPFPNELQELREKYLYNISPWTQSVQSAARKGIKLFYSDPEDQDDTEDEDKIALATAYGVFRRRESGSREVQPAGPTLDISVLKQQYAKLRQRQRQAHIIISAACSSSIPANLTSVPAVSVNHLLMGKSALVNKGRRIGPPEGSIPPPKNRTSKVAPDATKQVPKRSVVISGETLEWKDAERRGSRVGMESCNGVARKAAAGEDEAEDDANEVRRRRGSTSSASSTSTELCDDEVHRFSDFDSEEGNVKEVTEEEEEEEEEEGEATRREEIAKCARDLLRDIESELQTSDRLLRAVNNGNNNNASNNNGSGDDVTSSNHDNTVDAREESATRPEPEVPMTGHNVINNAENRIFDRSKEGDGEESDGRRRRSDRDRRKSDLALSVIKENLQMLSKFSQKASSPVREDEQPRDAEWEDAAEVDARANEEVAIATEAGTVGRREEREAAPTEEESVARNREAGAATATTEVQPEIPLRQVGGWDDRETAAATSLREPETKEREPLEAIATVVKEAEPDTPLQPVRRRQEDRVAATEPEANDRERADRTARRMDRNAEAATAMREPEPEAPTEAVARWEAREAAAETAEGKAEAKATVARRKEDVGAEDVSLTREPKPREEAVECVKRWEDREADVAREPQTEGEPVERGDRRKDREGIAAAAPVKEPEVKFQHVGRREGREAAAAAAAAVKDPEIDGELLERVARRKDAEAATATAIREPEVRVHHVGRQEDRETATAIGARGREVEEPESPERITVRRDREAAATRESTPEICIQEVGGREDRDGTTATATRDSEVKREEREAATEPEVSPLHAGRQADRDAMSGKAPEMEEREPLERIAVRKDRGRSMAATVTGEPVPEASIEPVRRWEESDATATATRKAELPLQRIQLATAARETEAEEREPLERISGRKAKSPVSEEAAREPVGRRKDPERMARRRDREVAREGEPEAPVRHARREGQVREEASAAEKEPEDTEAARKERIPAEAERSPSPRLRLSATSSPSDAESSPRTVSKVNKEVNTDITIATVMDGRKSEPRVDDFLMSLVSSHKSPERFKPEKIGFRDGTEGETGARAYGREDLAERWKKESERIESKIEMSKSDWDLKMKRIAELENTTREKLNEIKSRSFVHRHRSLDRFEARERDRRKSPIPKIEEPEGGDVCDVRKKRISALSFDEITSRTEKLLGTWSLAPESTHRKWRKSFEEDAVRAGGGGGSLLVGKPYEFYSSPTSPEYRQRRPSSSDHSSPGRRHDSRWRKHSQTNADEDWLTITEENNGRAAPSVDMTSRKPEAETAKTPTTDFNPFPTTRALSRPKELGVRLGMYPQDALPTTKKS